MRSACVLNYHLWLRVIHCERDEWPLACLKIVAGLLERETNSLDSLEIKSEFTLLAAIKFSELTARYKYKELVIFDGLMEQCYQEKSTLILLGRHKTLLSVLVVSSTLKVQDPVGIEKGT